MMCPLCCACTSCILIDSPLSTRLHYFQYTSKSSKCLLAREFSFGKEFFCTTKQLAIIICIPDAIFSPSFNKERWAKWWTLETLTSIISVYSTVDNVIGLVYWCTHYAASFLLTCYWNLLVPQDLKVQFRDPSISSAERSYVTWYLLREAGPGMD